MDDTFHPLHYEKSDVNGADGSADKDTKAYQMSQSVVHSTVDADPTSNNQPVLKLWTMRFPDYEQNRQYLQDTVRNLVQVAMAIEQAQPELVQELLAMGGAQEQQPQHKQQQKTAVSFKVPKVDKYTAQELSMDFPDEWKLDAKSTATATGAQ